MEQPIECLGFRIYTNPDDDTVSRHIEASKMWEPRATAILRESLKVGDIFIDAGAHIGYYSLLAASLGDTVYAFEPSGNNFQYLMKNIILNGFKQIYPFRCALWDKNGWLVLGEILIGNTADSRVHLRREEDTQPTMVQGLALDDLFPPPFQADWIKIDCQGTDHFVLKGALNLIGRSPNIRLLVEEEGGFDYGALYQDLGLCEAEYLAGDSQHLILRDGQTL